MYSQCSDALIASMTKAPPRPMKMIEMYLQLPTFFIEFISLGCLPSSSHPDKKMSLFQLCKVEKKKIKETAEHFLLRYIGKPTATDVTLAYTTLTTRTELCNSSFQAWTRWEGRPLAPALKIRVLILLMISLCSLFFPCSGVFHG